MNSLPIDFFRLDNELTAVQIQLRDQVRAFVQQVVLPHINPYWEQAAFPWEIVRQLPTLPVMGGTLTAPGCAGLDPISMGLVRYELAKGDGSVGTFYGVQSGLVMGSIGLLGSAEQQARWLPALASLDKIGSFGLTEPERGSDAAHVLTTAVRQGNSYVLNGRKRWIGNAPIADLLIVWAKDENGRFGGFVVEDPRQTEGVHIETMTGKIAKRAVLNGDIRLENVRIPAANRLEKAHSFRDTAKVLAFTRYAVAWEAAGLAAACLEQALAYAKSREQFGQPIAGFQLIQEKLVEMTAEVTQMQLLCLRLGQLMASGELDESMVALAKYNNARKARRVASLAREVLGGNGILIENHIARHLTDAEAIYTYEGTNEINMLIVGRALTGLGAFV
ncbi:MAG: acyl-CoA dehydrogenase family protein [Ardenticatenaceae bacterium]|nr:acyl-CoA dehydrogenase family protein [Ardenticatenaceae bacterium]